MPKNEEPEVFGRQYSFFEIFGQEIALINQRRANSRRGLIELETEPDADIYGEQVRAPAENANVVGLSLSGGGILSAAFCLGALQALEEARILEHVDYMSTVSGGGYIGCSLTAYLEKTAGQGWTFPFTSKRKEDEPPAVQHIRYYSNYLFPLGTISFSHNASIYMRGLVVNALLVAPFLLIGAAATLLPSLILIKLLQVRAVGGLSNRSYGSGCRRRLCPQLSEVP